MLNMDILNTIESEIIALDNKSRQSFRKEYRYRSTEILGNLTPAKRQKANLKAAARRAEGSAYFEAARRLHKTYIAILGLM